MALFLTNEQVLLNAATTTVTGTVFSAIDRQHVILTFATSWSANATIRVQGSNSDQVPNFSAAATVTNRWYNIQTKDYNDGTTVNGTVWTVYAGVDGVRIVELNTSRLKWVCVTITAISAGAITCTALWCNNQ